MGGIMILQSDIVFARKHCVLVLGRLPEYMESIHVLNNLTFHFDDE